MDTPNIQKNIRNIKDSLSTYSDEQYSYADKVTNMSSNLLNSKLTFVFIPTAILVGLFITKPKILYSTSIEESKNKDSKITTKTSNFSYKKLILCWLILSALFCVTLFVYNFRKKTPLS